MSDGSVFDHALAASLDKLEREGYVYRVRAPDGTLSYYLTEFGAEFVKRARTASGDRITEAP